MEKKFENRIVGITGYSVNYPNYNEMIWTIINLEVGKVTSNGQKTKEWEIGQVVIIGEEDFDKEYLIQSIEIGIEHNFTCQYFSLEDFWDFYTENGLYEPYVEGDERIEKHAGLAFLASLYFDYPNVDILGFGNRQQNNLTGWNAESILKANFGYCVGKGISTQIRRKALENAVRSPNIITLKQIAEHIAFLIKTRKGVAHMNSAVKRWSEDFEWLREKHYNKSIHNFGFPKLI